MTDCLRCSATSTGSYLCGRCTEHLRRTLAEMPWWLARLTEAAVGQTRMSDTAGRRAGRRRDLDGDAELAACIELLPDGEDLERARRQRAKLALAHALATGGINARASELLGTIADSLGYWARVLCEDRGLPPPQTAPGRSPGSAHARWLAAHINAVAATEYAGDIASDVEGHQDDIVRIVNRPLRIVELGDCPTWLEDGRQCGRPLRTPEDAVEVYCRSCRSTHNCNRLMLERMHAAERAPLPFEELIRINADQPPAYQVPSRTLRHWRATGLLRAHQWLRPDGRRGITQHSDADVALYSWADVKRLQLRKPQHRTTGAAARRNPE